MNGVTKPLSPHMTQNQPSISHIVNVNGVDRVADSDTRVVEPRPKDKEETRSARADPMSFSNILSNTTVDPPKPATESTPSAKASRPPDKPVNGDATPSATIGTLSTSIRRLAKKSPTVKDSPAAKETPKEASKTKAARSSNAKRLAAAEKENQKIVQAMAEIDVMEHSDVDGPGWEVPKRHHAQLMVKRLSEVEHNEGDKRKVSWCSLLWIMLTLA